MDTQLKYFQKFVFFFKKSNAIIRNFFRIIRNILKNTTKIQFALEESNKKNYYERRNIYL